MPGEKGGTGKHTRFAERGARHAEGSRGFAHHTTAGKGGRAPNEAPLGETDRTAHDHYLGVEHRRERRDPEGKCPRGIVGEAIALYTRMIGEKV